MVLAADLMVGSVPPAVELIRLARTLEREYKRDRKGRFARTGAAKVLAGLDDTIGRLKELSGSMSNEEHQSEVDEMLERMEFIRGEHKELMDRTEASMESQSGELRVHTYNGVVGVDSGDDEWEFEPKDAEEIAAAVDKLANLPITRSPDDPDPQRIGIEVVAGDVAPMAVERLDNGLTTLAAYDPDSGLLYEGGIEFGNDNEAREFADLLEEMAEKAATHAGLDTSAGSSTESVLSVLTPSPAARLMLYARSLEETDRFLRRGRMVSVERGAKGRFGDMLGGPDLDAIIANPKSGDRERVKAHFMAMKTPELKAEARKRGAYIGDVSRKDQIADRIVQREIGHKLDSQAIQKGGWDDSSAWTRSAQMQLGAKAEPDLDKMTNPQLKELAKAEGIKGFSKMRKAELVQAIQDRRGSNRGGVDHDEERARAKVRGNHPEGSPEREGLLRVARFDVAREKADLLAEVEGRIGIDEADMDVALREFERRAEAGGLVGDERFTALETALRNGDKDAALDAIERIGAQQGLRRIGGDPRRGPEQLVPFDRTKHETLAREPSGGVSAGTKVLLVRPGYEASTRDGSGVIRKAKVEHELTAEEIVAIEQGDLGNAAAPTSSKARIKPDPAMVVAELSREPSSNVAREHLMGMTVSDLQAVAAEAGIKGKERNKKKLIDEIVYMTIVGPRTLDDAQGNRTPKDADAPTPAVGDADEARALARVGRPDDGSKLYRSQLRQARIDVVRPRAQLLAEMEEVFSIAEGSDQPDAVRRRFDGAVKALGLEGDPKIAPLDEALRRGDIEGFHAAVAEVAASSKLRRIGGDPKLGPDQAVTFDPKQHDSLVKGELRAGDKAMVVRPGYAADIGDQPGLVLEKAVVHKAPTVGKADAQPKPGTVAALQKEHEEWLATRDERAAQADAVNQRMASLASALRKHEGNNEGMLAALKAENLDTKQLKRLADELNIDIPPAAKSKSARERYITTTAAEYSRRNGGMSPTTGSRLPRNPETAANPKLSASKASDLSSISAELAAFRANPQRGDREKVASILKPLRHAQLDEIARQNGWELPKKATLPQKRTQLEEHLVGRRLSSNAIFSLKDRPTARTALGGGEQPTSTQDNKQLTDLRRQLANVEAAEVSEIDSRRAAGMRGEARELRRQIARIESGADEGTVDQPREKTRAEIMAVYSQLVSRPGEILSLVKLRGNLPHIKHDELTEVLKQMDRERLIHLDPDPNTKAIPKAGHDAAIRLGGEDKHFITIR